MQNATAMLHCANPLCQTPNAEGNKFCQKCRTPLVRRYLWAVGKLAATYQPGEMLADRYACKGPRIFLDTKPALLSSTATEVPEAFVPYLRLSPWQFHVPQIYDWVQLEAAADAIILLLDGVPLTLGESPSLAQAHELVPQLLPTLAEQWPNATALRQLNWLWQIANLWHPLSSEHLTSTLFEPELLRVEGSLVRFLELHVDAAKPAGLMALGQLWLQWIPMARPEIAGFLQQLCQDLVQEQLHNAELLIQRLDEAIAQVGRAQTREIQIATYSDQGPTRQRNEDACYPASGTLQTMAAKEAPLVIVCDGIGGHQGGDVASHLAIETLEERVKALDPNRLDPIALMVELEKAVCAANDQISQRNDSEQRYDRQRMGTTLVMGLVRTHELYITHVGDSRAYWISRSSCHQVTLDDDVASREVRLGYSAYRQALQQPGAGSLVQALGMGTSTLLYPTVQRFLLDEDSVFLLCSDGLSDNDRIEEFWQSEILPLLDGRADLATVAQRLIEIGNTQNGYDNVTVGIIYCRVAEAQPVPVLPGPAVTRPVKAQEEPRTALVPAVPTLPPTPAPTAPLPDPDPTLSTLKTQIPARRPSSNPNLVGLVLGILVLLGIGGGLLAYWILPLHRKQANSARLTPVPSFSPASPSPSPTPAALLVAGSLIQINRVAAPDPATGSSFLMLSKPQLSQPTPSSTPTPAATPTPSEITAQPVGTLPVGSILQVLTIQEGPQQDRWVQLQVCSTPAGASPEDPSPRPEATATEQAGGQSPVASPAPGERSPQATVQPGQTGWIQETEILPWVDSVNLSPDRQGGCASPTPVGSPSARRVNRLLIVASLEEWIMG